MRARWRDRTTDQSDQGEGKGYIQHSALQETTKDDGNRATTLRYGASQGGQKNS